MGEQEYAEPEARRIVTCTECNGDGCRSCGNTGEGQVEAELITLADLEEIALADDWRGCLPDCTLPEDSASYQCRELCEGYSQLRASHETLLAALKRLCDVSGRSRAVSDAREQAQAAIAIALNGASKEESA
jgi:hypothetical protein